MVIHPMQPASSPRPTRVRHVVLWITVAAYMITYMDRVVMSNALPAIRKELDLSLGDASLIAGAFRLGYALFQIPGGWLGDRFGPRLVLAAIVSWWSVFTAATTLAWNATSMIAVRFLFGVGEAGAFPIATRSLSRWVLPTERGYAQGVTHAGSRLGAAITPPLVAFIILGYGWRPAFWVFGLIGLVWAAVWYWYYRDTPEEHSGVNQAELDLIHSHVKLKGKAGAIPWARILRSPNVWALGAMYYCYGHCLAVYLDWFPTYLTENWHVDLKKMGFYAALPLVAGTLGDFLGGWASDHWAKRSGNLRLARRAVAIFGFLFAAAAIVPATLATNPEANVLFSCLAVFGIEVTVGVSWAVPLDIGGDFSGSVAAVMNTCGNMGGFIATTAVGYMVKAYGWNAPFVVSGAACLLAAVLFSRIDAGKAIFRTGEAQ
ncbi:MAG: MFS transporter [Acidobacteria bacterium]|nr:MFS transporter [Acidobacteriota bacterium]